ncbi:MAG: hypothetical protein FJ096_04325 [Deltaproteobacteria bacterium]|nr:hypothetical protein [Deltaproteobacteria bacterium]
MLPSKTALGAVVLSIVGCQQGFTDADITALESTIRSEFGRRPGVTVKEVHLIKESPQKLSGFAKLEAAGIEVMKSCSATWGESGKYIWKCE